MELINLDIAAWYIFFFVVLLALQKILPKYPEWTEIRKIPALEASVEGVRICAEKGRPLFMGTGGLNPIRNSSLYADVALCPAVMNLMRHLAKQCGELGVRFISASWHAITTVMQRDYKAQGFLESGHGELSRDEDSIYYPDLTTYVIGCQSVIGTEHPGTGIVLGVHWWMVAAVLNSALAREGAFMIAGDNYPSDTMVSAGIVDYLNFGEENVAMGAALSDDPEERSSIVAEDFIKIAVVIATIVLIPAMLTGAM
jgi:hypothetical protein